MLKTLRERIDDMANGFRGRTSHNGDKTIRNANASIHDQHESTIRRHRNCQRGMLGMIQSESLPVLRQSPRTFPTAVATQAHKGQLDDNTEDHNIYVLDCKMCQHFASAAQHPCQYRGVLVLA